MSHNVIEVLKERGFIDAITDESLVEAVKQPIKVYAGFDPTADSLHIGHMVAIMGLAWFQKFGHQPVVIAGGATGMIGDPSGKLSARQLLDEETIQNNLKGIQSGLRSVLSAGGGKSEPIYLNNYDWFKNFSFVTFLRDVGKHFRMGPMLSKDSVKTRLNSDEGLSFTEFSYQVLQAYDFYYLNENYGVTLQMGGSDQWGNITAGTELIRKISGKQAFGLTFPLLVKSDGQKFGKSEKGAIWLSRDKLSAYDFYQYLVRVQDSEVIQLLRLLTFVDMPTIETLKREMQEPGYEPNKAQKLLAQEVTRIVHGNESLQEALVITQQAAPGALKNLSADNLKDLVGKIPTFEYSKEACIGKKWIDLLAESALVPSKGEGKRLIKNGGVSINAVRLEDENATSSEKDFIENRYAMVTVGKKNKALFVLL